MIYWEHAAMKGKTFWVLLVAFLAGGGVIGWQAWQTWMDGTTAGNRLRKRAG